MSLCRVHQVLVAEDFQRNLEPVRRVYQFVGIVVESPFECAGVSFQKRPVLGEGRETGQVPAAQKSPRKCDGSVQQDTRVDDQILVVEFLIWTDRFPLARDLRLAGRVPHRRWMPSQLPFTAPGNRAVIECSTKTESVPGKSLTIPSYVAVKERRIRITKGQQKVTQRVHTESSNFVFHIALCANMNETPTPKEFRVEGEEGVGDECVNWRGGSGSICERG